MAWIDFDTPAPGRPFIVLPALVNGVTAKVLLDTGAGVPFDILISPELAARNSIAAAGDSQAGTVIGAGGAGFAPATLPALEIGGTSLRDVSAGISPVIASVSQQLGRPIDAIIGSRFLAGRTIAIDYRNHRVDLAADAGDPRDAIAFQLSPKKPLAIVSATINGHGPFAMALDTGASSTLLSSATAEKAGLTGTQAVSLGGGGGASAKGALLGTGDMVLGAYSRTRQQMAIADVLAPVEAACGATLDGVLGADFLSDMLVRIDYAGQLLWIEDPA